MLCIYNNFIICNNACQYIFENLFHFFTKRKFLTYYSRADAEPAAETTAPAEEPAAEDAATETPAAESTDITLWT